MNWSCNSEASDGRNDGTKGRGKGEREKGRKGRGDEGRVEGGRRRVKGREKTVIDTGRSVKREWSRGSRGLGGRGIDTVCFALALAVPIHRVGLSTNIRGRVYLASTRSHVPNNLFGSDLV